MDDEQKGRRSDPTQDAVARAFPTANFVQVEAEVGPAGFAGTSGIHISADGTIWRRFKFAYRNIRTGKLWTFQIDAPSADAARAEIEASFAPRDREKLRWAWTEAPP